MCHTQVSVLSQHVSLLQEEHKELQPELDQVGLTQQVTCFAQQFAFGPNLRATKSAHEQGCFQANAK